MNLDDRSSVLGLRIYIVIVVLAGVAFALSLLLVLFVVRFVLLRRRSSATDRRRSGARVNHDSLSTSAPENEIERRSAGGGGEAGKRRKGYWFGGDLCSEGEDAGSSAAGALPPSTEAVTARMGNIGWGRWYALCDLEIATGSFCPKNVIGKGGYGVVYRGVLQDLSIVAVKNLLNNKGQAEKEFKVEVEAIGKVRHKNLVGLVGYCAEGSKRMLIYEYVENGNLEQWLHGDVGKASPLTWDIRMKIAIGTAKGIAYLHEGLEPKVVHRDIKSSNILLDREWNPRVSDFGLAKLLGSDSSFVTTRVMGTFGYVSPEYANTGMLNEASDVYSFGVLLMELISGRDPVDYNRPNGEVNLVDWFKGMVGSRRGEQVIDPLIEIQPPPRALKRLLLICLRCIDLDAQKRPKMGQIVHMLEGEEFPFRLEHRVLRGKEPNRSNAQLLLPSSSIPL